MQLKDVCDAIVVACGLASLAIGVASVIVYVRFLSGY